MSEHLVILSQIVDSVTEIGRAPYFTEIASIDIPTQAAENAAEVEIISATGKKYLLSVYSEE